MEILSSVFITLMGCSMLGLLYLIRRNNQVYEFRHTVNIACFDYSMRHIKDDDLKSAYDWCWAKLPPYNDMVWSFKPLTLETYISVEDIEKLLN